MVLKLFRFREDCIDKYSERYKVSKKETIYRFKKIGMYWSLVIFQRDIQHCGNWDTFLDRMERYVASGIEDGRIKTIEDRMPNDDPLMMRCLRDFAEAHGMSEIEASAYFDDFDLYRFIRRNRAGLGRSRKDIVPILHNVVTKKGGQLPEILDTIGDNDSTTADIE